MRLNVINTSSVVALAASTACCKLSSSRFGTLTQINDKVFKYVFTGARKEVLLIERIDLAELFAGLPQDISEMDAHVPTPTTLGVDILMALGIDPTQQESPFIDGEPTAGRDGDDLGNLFHIWQAYVGLYGLSRHEVELSTVDNILYIDARNATMFRGMLPVKILKDTVNE